MYNFIRLQYIMGKITADDVRRFAPRWITVEQAREIISTAREAEEQI